MKNKKLLVLMPILLLALASCDDGSSVVSPSTGDNSGTASSTTPVSGEWKSELKALMNSMLGETLPYYELGNYEFSKESDDTGVIFTYTPNQIKIS